MNKDLQIFEEHGGKLLIPSDLFIARCEKIKALVLDWDGVFNSGVKDQMGSSPFNEVDSMGSNLLRYSLFLKNGKLPVSAIISGEKNSAAFYWGEREHFNASYFRIKHKIDAIRHLCDENNVHENEIAFIFDDVLDLSAAKHVGLRIFIPRNSNPLFNRFVIQNNLADYVCYSHSGDNAVREASELIMAGLGNFNAVIQNRMDYAKTYHEYIQKRNEGKTHFFTIENNEIIKVEKP